MKVLAIGNSFSEDAMRYLHDMAKKEGEKITTMNLYIGGCPLRTHYLNTLSDAYKYNLVFNGYPTDVMVSIKQALISREWDYITLQQASPVSYDFETYEPYLTSLYEYVKKYCPKAKILIHQTWAYENESPAMLKTNFTSHEEMFKKIEKAYKLAYKSIKADGLIPCGKVACELYKKGFKMHRDGKHISFGIGRYALALTWFKFLTGKDIASNDFVPFDGEITEEERKAVIEVVSSLK
jgi:hypothetical protein